MSISLTSGHKILIVSSGRGVKKLLIMLLDRPRPILVNGHIANAWVFVLDNKLMAVV